MSENNFDMPENSGTCGVPMSLVSFGQKAASAGSICVGFSGSDISGAAGLILASTASLCGGTVYLCDGLTPAETLFAGRRQRANLAVYIGESLTPDFYSLAADPQPEDGSKSTGRLLFIDSTEKKYTDSFKSYTKLKGVRLSVGSEGRGNRLFRIAAVKAGAFIHPPEDGIPVYNVSDNGMSISVMDEAGISHSFKEISRFLENSGVSISDGIQAGFEVISASVEDRKTVGSLFRENSQTGAIAEKTLWVNGGAARALAAFYRKYRGEAIPHKDGYLCDFGDEKVKIYPCHAGSQIKIAAESFSTETALELCSGMEMIIERLSEGK